MELPLQVLQSPQVLLRTNVCRRDVNGKAKREK